MHTLFTILGWFGVGFSLLCLPTALFVGPHLLVAATGFAAFGLSSLLASRGLQRNAKWASWFAVALCVLALAVTLVAVVQSAKAAAWDSAVVWTIAATYFAAMLVALFTQRGK